MFPAGEDAPLMTGTPVPADAAAAAAVPAPDLERAVGQDQAELFDTSTLTFDPATITAALSAGEWTVAEGPADVPGYAYKITTRSRSGRNWPVAVAVTPADAAILTQSKRLLDLVVRAFGMTPEQFAADWQVWRRDAIRTMLDCRDTQNS